MLPISYVSEQGKRFFPITHRTAIVGLATNTLVLSESVDVDIDINVDGEPITINPVVQKEISNLNISITNINTGINQINEALKTKASSDTNGIAYNAHKLQTARKITISGSVTGDVTFDGSKNVTISVSTNHTHNYAGSSSAGGSANAAVKLETARNIKLDGVVTGNANFDGTGNITISTKFGNSSNYLPLSGGTVTGAFTAKGNIRTDSRYYQGGNVGSLTAIQYGTPATTMLWAW